MNRQLAQRAATGASTSLSAMPGRLQRKCACGTHTPGGGACAACEGKNEGLQRKLALGSVNDPLEHEADRIAEQVVTKTGPVGINPAPPRIQRASASSAIGHDVAPPSVLRILADSGRPLDAPLRRDMEERFGHDFSQVRVHQSRAAAQSAIDVGALAYTIGRNIVFGANQFAPETRAGRRLLAHELTHVVQQSSSANVDPQGGSSRVLQRTPAPPTNASGNAPRDLDRIRIDALADFTAKSLAAPRDVNVHVNDSAIVHMTWLLYDPTDQMVSGFSTLPGRDNSTSAPFTLEPSYFMKTGFVAGKHVLRCIGLGGNHEPVVYADRDFNVLTADLKTNMPLATTYGSLTYTDYRKKDATLTDSRFYIDVTIRFLPSNIVNCTQIGWIQAVQAFNPNGTSRQVNISAEQDARKTPLAWAIDQLAGIPSPFYVMGLDSAGALAVDPGAGTFGSGGKTPKAADLIDQPSSTTSVVYRFESCAVCRTGATAGQVYGCTTWGYSSTVGGKVTLMPRSFRQMPSDEFVEARALWNTWGGGQPKASQPEMAPALKSP